MERRKLLFRIRGGPHKIADRCYGLRADLVGWWTGKWRRCLVVWGNAWHPFIAVNV